MRPLDANSRNSGCGKRALSFTFNGRRLAGYEGETLAAALLANGVKTVARSFKFHRPRGIIAAGVEEPNCLVTVYVGTQREVNLRATEVELHDGLRVRSVNCWPNPWFDIASVLDCLHQFLPAGFYYKTFKWPSWKYFEPLVRRLAGLGSPSGNVDPDKYVKQHSTCDVLVVGSGPAGLAAAAAAARSGSRVVLCEQDPALALSAKLVRGQIDGASAQDWALQAVRELQSRPNVRILTRATVTSYTDHNFVLILERQSASMNLSWSKRLHCIRAKQIIYATGAIERPIVFPDNDVPGVMLASAVHTYWQRFSVRCAHRLFIFTNNDSVYPLIPEFIRAGITVAGVADVRADVSARLAKICKDSEVPFFGGHGVSRVYGRQSVRRVAITNLRTPSRSVVIECDAIAMSGGFSPAIHLYSQAGGKSRYDSENACFVPATQLQNCVVVGSANGKFRLEDCLSEGAGAGSAAAAACGHEKVEGGEPICSSEDAETITPFWQTPSRVSKNRRQWIDFQNDVTSHDVAIAASENLTSVEHFKRYTTLGMAPDQGKTSNINGLGVLAELTGRAPSQVGTTTFRPPYTPVTFGAIAGKATGKFYSPTQRIPTHDIQIERHAVMENYSDWVRPAFYSLPSILSNPSQPRARATGSGATRYYAMPGDVEQSAIIREVKAVREAVGICDYSPLGKIEVCGPDALTFLNRFAMTNVESIRVGRARYNLMLNEVGCIIDDGIISRLSEDSFLVGTTSSGVTRIASLMEEWRQCEWPDLKVFISNVTSGWGVVLVSGPQARQLMMRLDSDIDYSPSAFPHMSVRTGRISGTTARVHRVSFTGEISYEVAVPWNFLPTLWQMLEQAGADLGVTPFGIESLLVLRAEKGFIHVGTDTDGTTNPDDIGFGDVARKKRIDFIGKRSLSLPEATRSGRCQFVGLIPVDEDDSPLPIGGQLTSKASAISSEGWVTTSCYSPTLNRPIALALINNGRSRIGEIMHVGGLQGRRVARITAPTFIDPSGDRINA